MLEIQGKIIKERIQIQNKENEKRINISVEIPSTIMNGLKSYQKFDMR